MAGTLKNEDFLRRFGGVEANDLTKILNSDSDIDDNAATIIKMSNYHDIDDILDNPTFSDKNQFKILSFNTESIQSKLDEIKLFLESLMTKNILFDAICVDECWLEDFGDDLNLPGYSAFPLTCKVSRKGGLVTYIQENYRVKELDLYSDSKSWEGQFFEIHSNGLRNKLLLSNLYRPPRSTEHVIEFENKQLTNR